MRDPIRESLTDEELALIEAGLTGEDREAFITAFCRNARVSPERAENVLRHLEQGGSSVAAETLFQRRRKPVRLNRAQRRARQRRRR